MHVKGSIVAQNSATTGADCIGGIVSYGYNLEKATSCGFTSTGDKQNTDPLLDSLWNNGGATQTRALLPGSPAIDAGVCTDGDSAAVAVDQRAIARPADGDNSGSAACDIGAFERRWVPPMGVTTTDDEYGEVLDRCSLREMIQAVNTGADFGGCRLSSGYVSVPGGTYTLTRAGADEDNNATGDLDIKANINLVGAGNTATVINGNALDRVIQVHSGTATITDLKITGGEDHRHEPDGGGLANAGTLTLNRVVVASNTAAGAGGGIANTGTLTLSGGKIQSNQSNLSGGGIHNSGSLTVNSGCLVDSNTSLSTASSDGGGGINTTGTLVVNGEHDPE